MQPIKWENALLLENPFPEVPPLNPEDANWASMPALKSQLDELFAEALSTSTSQVVLNWGAYGSGKTHAAVYYGTPEHLPSKAKKVRDIWNLYLHTPRDPSQAISKFYQDVLEQITFKGLRSVISELTEQHGDQEILAHIQEHVGSEVLGRAIWLLGRMSEGPRQLQLYGLEGMPTEWDRSLEAYFYSQQTKNDLKRLGLSRGISGGEDHFRVLSTIIQCLIGFKSSGDIGSHSRVILWIDEMEDLIYFTSRQYRPFTQGLRQLADRLPRYFTLLMNFTLASPEVFEDTTVVLGQAVMDRITHQIYFREPDKKEAFRYVVDLLRFFRTTDPKELGLRETYPFTKKSLENVIEMLGQPTPREINIRCSEVITKALTRGVISAPGEGEITIEFLADLEQERLDQEF